ncbi:MAG: hypothetical protein O2894_00850 [Planctomycetota bacterium]|nr:hypothetical protein [Planctomycetota bacterium]
MRLVLPVAAILLLAGLLPAVPLAMRAAAADEDLERLAPLDNPEHPRHEAARTWWEQTSEPTRVAILRRALAADDPALARFGARGIGYPYLDAAELARKMEILRADPHLTFAEAPAWGLGGRHAFGADDVVPFYRAAAADPALDLSAAVLDLPHRAARTEHAEALVALLPVGGARAFGGTLFTVLNLGEHDRTDAARAHIARGALYGLRRLRAERAGRPRPEALPAVEITSAPEGGLPPAFLEVAYATHPTEPNGFSIGDYGTPHSVVEPFHWLRRWLLTLTPGPKDVPYLREVVRVASDAPASHPYAGTPLRWALTHLARLGATEDVRSWAKEPDMRGDYAAAVLARIGEPALFERRLAAAEVDSAVEDLLWVVDRPKARARAARALLDAGLGAASPRHPLTPTGRMDLRVYEGIDISSEDLDAIAEVLWDETATDDADALLGLAWFFAEIHPIALNPGRAATLLQRLATMPTFDWQDESFEEWARVLAVLEVRDEPATVHMLEAWLESQPEVRADILLMLARLGAPRHERAMIAAWPHWEPEHAWALGRVPGAAIEAFLISRRAGDPAEEDAGLRAAQSVQALMAMLVRRGMHPSVGALLENLAMRAENDPDATRPELETAWGRLLAGDVADCVLGMATESYTTHPVGDLDAPVARSWLRTRRDARGGGTYWDATFALVPADHDAYQETRRLLRSGRTWIIDQLQNEGATRGDRAELTALLLDDLDSNCCLAWAAHLLLQELHPWLTIDPAHGGAGRLQTHVWIESTNWRESRIFGGPVPGPR